jgi:hypothetical protein
MEKIKSRSNSQSFNLEDNYNTISIFATTIALTTACLYYFAKIDSDRYFLSILKTLLSSFFLLLFPQGYRLLAAELNLQNQQKYSWLTSDAFLSLLALIILTLSGSLVITFNLNFLPILATIGLALAILAYPIFFQKTKFLTAIIFLFFSIVLGGWFATTLLSHEWRSPLSEEILAMGKLPFSKDQLFHASVANSIATYGIPSTALDGTPYLSYHFASHWIFARLSNLINLTILQFYQLGYTVIIVPFLLKSILSCSLEIWQYFNSKVKTINLRSNIIYWAIFAIAYINIIPAKLIQDTLPAWKMPPQSLQSESHVLSLAFLFILLSLTLHFCRENFNDFKNLDKIDIVFIVSIFPLLFGLICLTKISTGLLALVTIVYLFVRLKLYHNKIFIVGAIVLLSLFVIIYKFTASGHSTQFKILGFLGDYVGKGWQPFFLLFHLFWSWLFIILKLQATNIKTLVDLKQAYLSRQTIDVELVFIFALVGILPGTILDIADGSAFFFSEVQTWVALGFILGNLPLFILSFRKVFNER